MASTSSPPTTSQPIRVTLEDGSEVSYTLRGLANDDEILRWADFCASVFAYKANPPPAAYFARHYFNDPDRSSDLIRVLIFHNDDAKDEGSIVASCRVFQRTISTGKIDECTTTTTTTLRAGGVGEVCTDPAHRRRGLSKLLLEDAIRIMKERNMQVSLLHAAPVFFPVYQSVGYASSLSRWSVVSLSMDMPLAESTTDARITIRQGEFPIDTKPLQRLHQQFTQEGLAGSIVRTETYWNEYLCQELKGAFWVLQQQDNNRGASIVGWLSIRARGENRFQLQEFGCDRNAEMAKPSYARIFGLLLERALQAMPDGHNQSSPYQLVLPTFCLDDIRRDRKNNMFVDWSSEVLEDDLGWMYKILGDDNSSAINLPEVSQKCPHLIWPSDAF